MLVGLLQIIYKIYQQNASNLFHTSVISIVRKKLHLFKNINLIRLP
jgi:hypothetical protein